MIGWLHTRAGYRDDGICSGLFRRRSSSPLYSPTELVLFSPHCTLPRRIVIYTYFTCLHTGDLTTPLLFAQRVSPLLLVGVKKQLHLSRYRIEGSPFSSQTRWSSRKCVKGVLSLWCLSVLLLFWSFPGQLEKRGLWVGVVLSVASYLCSL